MITRLKFKLKQQSYLCYWDIRYDRHLTKCTNIFSSVFRCEKCMRLVVIHPWKLLPCSTIRYSQQCSVSCHWRDKIQLRQIKLSEYNWTIVTNNTLLLDLFLCTVVQTIKWRIVKFNMYWLFSTMKAFSGKQRTKDWFN